MHKWAFVFNLDHSFTHDLSHMFINFIPSIMRKTCHQLSFLFYVFSHLTMRKNIITSMSSYEKYTQSRNFLRLGSLCQHFGRQKNAALFQSPSRNSVSLDLCFSFPKTPHSRMNISVTIPFLLQLCLSKFIKVLSSQRNLPCPSSQKEVMFICSPFLPCEYSG